MDRLFDFFAAHRDLLRECGIEATGNPDLDRIIEQKVRVLQSWLTDPASLRVGVFSELITQAANDPKVRSAISQNTELMQAIGQTAAEQAQYDEGGMSTLFTQVFEPES
ncbi:hypothetical protein JW887_05245 [Candidatus Dojkabacteria bacterium]|nr:hypothetical protein [Candidatus Dojkabacteria bacterium]